MTAPLLQRTRGLFKAAVEREEELTSTDNKLDTEANQGGESRE
jgi:hypothetical protein